MSDSKYDVSKISSSETHSDFHKISESDSQLLNIT